MASAMYILDSKGEPLVFRSYRGDVTQNVPAVFERRVLAEEEINVTPIFEEEGFTYVYTRVNDVYLLLVSRININPLLQFTFLQRCVSVFESYFTKVTEEAIQDNFVIVYELLDEMCDFGYPQYTEEKVLKEYITQERFVATLLGTDTIEKSSLPDAVTATGGATPWRIAGKYSYRKNEIFLDVVESVNLLVNQKGDVLSQEVVGQILMRSRLSGMPTVKVGINDRLLYDGRGVSKSDSVFMDDIKFHECVKLNQFEAERVIEFIPPDGAFELLTYRCSHLKRLIIALTCNVTRHGSSRVELRIDGSTRYTRQTVASIIKVIVPLPSDADKPEGTWSNGNVKYAPEKACLEWTMHNVSGNKSFNMWTSYHLPSVRSSEASAWEKAPIKVNFTIPYFTASGLQVRYVRIIEDDNYKAVPWVRYLTQNGDYQIRTSEAP